MSLDFGQVIHQKRIEKSLSQKKLGHAAGVTGTYIADMENFGKIPKDEVVLKLAQALGLDPAYFLLLALTERYGEDNDVVKLYEKAFESYSLARARGEIDGPPGETLHPAVETAKIMQALERGLKVIIADPEQVQQEPYSRMVQDLEKKVSEEWANDFSDYRIISGEPAPYRYTVPVISYVSAGEPFQWTDGGFEPGQGLEMVDLPPGVDPELAEKIYAVRVRGDSMSPYLKDGSTLFVKPESRGQIRPGDYVIFKDQDFNAWVKMVHFHNNQIVLRSLNPEYPDMVKNKDELILLERVIAVTF